MQRKQKPDLVFQKLSQQYKWINLFVYDIILENAKKYNLEIKLICALIQEESGTYCNNNLRHMKKVISYAGAIGIMQVMYFHFDNPAQGKVLRHNIKKGCWYLKKSLKKAKGNIREACRFYNAGLGSIRDKYKGWAYVYRIERNYFRS
jgi:soluble lytic murein transglycosylase-like protein